MCWNSCYDHYPSYLLPFVTHPWLTWSGLGALDLAAVVLCHLSVTRPLPRGWAVATWLVLPISIALTMLFLVILASRLFQGLHK
jgi:hypothetical protein